LNKIFKIISLLLIQAILLSNAALVNAQNYAFTARELDQSTLSPKVSFSTSAFQNLYISFVNNGLVDIDLLSGESTINIADAENNGTLISAKTTNFKIGSHNFRVPPYLAGRVVRVHITAINSRGFTFQKMGIGVGRRKKTIAVILVNIYDADNQLLIFEDKGSVKLKQLGLPQKIETIAFGRNAGFDSMQRQDSFLERTNIGISFLDRILRIGQAKRGKPDEVVAALNDLSLINPKLKSDMPLNLAFFSQDYMITFSKNLKKHSHIAILRDREQRGRFIAIVDKLNPANRVVFERRGEQIYVLGAKERLIIPKIRKHEKMQTIYFTDIEEGAEFCRNVTRNLVENKFADKSHSISMRKNVQLNIGAYNSDTTLLKVNQVTQATGTGYQIKQKTPELMDETIASYPLYVLRADFKHDLSVSEADIDYESSDFLFFRPDYIKKWPAYLSFGNAGDSVYYQHLSGIYHYAGQDYTVYRVIIKDDILTFLSFSNEGSFTIKGINWKDGKPIVFRNIKNIALSNIVTQLNTSKFIDIDPVLKEYFDVADFETTRNPMRSTYEFKNGVFEQGSNIKMKELIDFSKIQAREDKKIKKDKNPKLKITKAALILSAFSMVFAPKFLSAKVIGTALNIIPMEFTSEYNFLNAFILGMVIISGWTLFHIFKRIKDMYRPIEISFNKSRRDFLYTSSIKSIIGFLMLQTGGLAYLKIYKDLNSLKDETELRPAIVGNLKNLALIYKTMPDYMYAENKRLALPMHYEYWQMFFKLKSKEKAIKAVKIYRENAEAVLKLYSSPRLANHNMSASQLLLLIAARISGKDIQIEEKKVILKRSKEEKILAKSDDQINVIFAAGISGPLIQKIESLKKSRLVKREDKREIIFKRKKISREQSVQIMKDKVELSDEGRLFYQRMMWLNKIEQAI